MIPPRLSEYQLNVCLERGSNTNQDNNEGILFFDQFVDASE